jgi:hypothetical protein
MSQGQAIATDNEQGVTVTWCIMLPAFLVNSSGPCPVMVLQVIPSMSRRLNWISSNSESGLRLLYHEYSWLWLLLPSLCSTYYVVWLYNTRVDNQISKLSRQWLRRSRIEAISKNAGNQLRWRHCPSLLQHTVSSIVQLLQHPRRQVVMNSLDI